jgi:hypothetical protein
MQRLTSLVATLLCSRLRRVVAGPHAVEKGELTNRG